MKTEIERDWVRIAGQIVYRPENLVPGDFIAFFERLNQDAERAYQQGYEEGVAEKEKSDTESYAAGYEQGYSETRAEFT